MHMIKREYDGYFLPDTATRLAAMKGGNATHGCFRDLSMRKKEYWETRPHPAKPYHWTANEFEAFLLEHRYPSNTLSDRMACHVQSIRHALVQGEYVPPEVMQTEEGAAALTDAVMDVQSLDSGAFKTAQQESAKAEFDLKLSMHAEHKQVAHDALLAELIIQGVKAYVAAKGHHDKVEPIHVGWHTDPLYVVITRSESSSARLPRVHVQHAGWGLYGLYGHMRTLEWSFVHSTLICAMKSGQLSYDDCAWFCGTEWAPVAGIVRQVQSADFSIG